MWTVVFFMTLTTLYLRSTWQMSSASFRISHFLWWVYIRTGFGSPFLILVNLENLKKIINKVKFVGKIISPNLLVVKAQYIYMRITTV